mmetsp:Transcript_65226/g.155787  ORF Transcript_65226/g.155787 Transcript_65226/m.155787 type:complete len:202 (-) Transcript_65226:63-668(-)
MHGDTAEAPALNADPEAAGDEEMAPPAVPEPEDMTVQQRSAHALKCKEIGNKAFREQDWDYAVYAYHEGLRYLAFEPGSEGVPLQGFDHGGESQLNADASLASVLLSNLAAVVLKAQSDASRAVEYCSQALQFHPENVKAILRRSQAYLQLGWHAEALKDVEQFLLEEPQSAEALRIKKAAEVGCRKSAQREKAMCAKMFG